MLELVGLKTVHMLSSTSDTKQATVTVTVKASGHQLPLTVIFEGRNSPAGPLHVMQKKAWTDEIVMLQWVDKVLSPYVITQPIISSLYYYWIFISVT